MSIRLGSGSFLLKSYDPEAIEVPKNDQEVYDYTIERRQRYFSILWMPFFGIGKYWAIRTQEGKLVDPPYHIANHLDTLEIRMRSPWYTFVGPILLVLAIGGFYGWTVLDQQQRVQPYIEKYEAESQALLTQLDNLEEGDYLQFGSPGGRWRIFQYGGTTAGKLKLIGPRSIDITEGDKEILEAFATYPPDETEQLLVELASLKTTVCQVYEQRSRCRGANIQEEGREPLRFKKVLRLTSPNAPE